MSAYRFGPFRLRVADRILDRDGERISLTPKVIDTLLVLLDNSGQVVTKEELMRAVWPDVSVVESGLTRNISVLRKAIEEGLEEGAFIETIPRRGYRFVGQVTKEVDGAALNTPAAAPPRDAPVPREPRRPVWFRVAALAGLLASVATIWAITGRDPVAAPIRVEPFVRIGEHLLYKLAPEETLRALEHFERAIAANPRSAGAHAGLSIALMQLNCFGVWLPKAPVLTAADAARKAVQLDANSGPAHYSMAMVHTFQDWDFPRADIEFRRALELDPNSVQTRLGFARRRLATGDVPGARRLVEEALRIDPASPPLGVEYCRVFYYQRDFRRAESECRKVLDREPGYALAHYYLAMILGALGRIQEAEASLEASRLMPGVLEADYAWLSLLGGDRRPALNALEERRELMRQGKVSATAKLLLATILNRNEEAFEALEVGLADRAPELLTLAIEPRLDDLRNDSRYPEVVRRITAAR